MRYSNILFVACVVCSVFRSETLNGQSFANLRLLSEGPGGASPSNETDPPIPFVPVITDLGPGVSPRFVNNNGMVVYTKGAYSWASSWYRYRKGVEEVLLPSRSGRIAITDINNNDEIVGILRPYDEIVAAGYTRNTQYWRADSQFAEYWTLPEQIERKWLSSIDDNGGVILHVNEDWGWLEGSTYYSRSKVIPEYASNGDAVWNYGLLLGHGSVGGQHVANMDIEGAGDSGYFVGGVYDADQDLWKDIYGHVGGSERPMPFLLYQKMAINRDGVIFGNSWPVQSDSTASYDALEYLPVRYWDPNGGEGVRSLGKTLNTDRDWNHASRIGISSPSGPDEPLRLVLNDRILEGHMQENGSRLFQPYRLLERFPQNAGWSDLQLFGISDNGKYVIATARKEGIEHGLLLTLVEADLVADFDRDGALTGTDLKRARSGAVYRYWVNDDGDYGDVGGDDMPAGIYANYLPDNFDLSGYAHEEKINGSRDLVDFFPICLDIKNLLELAPATVGTVYKIRHSGGSLNFAYTSLDRDRFDTYHRELYDSGFGDDFNQSSGSAATHQVTADGVALNTEFLERIKNGGSGVLIFEGRAQSSEPLILDVEQSGSIIASIKIALRINNVRDMFRHVDLTRYATEYDGSKSSLPTDSFVTRNGDPGEAFPDSLTNGKYLVFVHGYKVNSAKAQGWHSEMFKRFYVLGSKARFVGVSWHGATGFAGLDYHKAVFNAFQAGDILGKELAFTDGSDVVIMAHSLGNMLVSHSIQEGRFIPNKYYMLNAAVPIEAYDHSNVDEAHWKSMVEDDWKMRNRKFYASNWHELFKVTPLDNRNRLTWKNRFYNVFARTETYNFYTGGEEVVENPTTNSAALLVKLVTYGTDVNRGTWVAQEMIKGVNWTTSLGDFAFDRGQAGWDSDLAYFYTPHEKITNEQLMTRPFFDEFIEDDLLSSDVEIASAKAGESKVLYDLLARGIPALSWGVAANQVPVFGGYNVDMEVHGRAGGTWPSAGHLGDQEIGRWLHSDFKAVSLPYVNPLYMMMIKEGLLK